MSNNEKITKHKWIIIGHLAWLDSVDLETRHRRLASTHFPANDAEAFNLQLPAGYNATGLANL